MNTNEKRAVGLYVVLSLLAIVVLIVLVAKKKNCGEGYRKCVCSQADAGRRQVCQDTEQVWKNYQNGLTEYAPMPKHREWTTISPGDMDFPPTNCPHYKSWAEWDFAGFGSA
uniref:Uncharacterized protein n=1 Tax=viral metagenome TaxID=1070528 RepID=A0A6C0EJF0_9ZZZZ